MRSFPILVDLGLVVTAAALLLLIGRPLRLPPIVSYLLAGLLLGPATGLLGSSESIELFSHLGVALLLFIVGLELRLTTVRNLGPTVLLVGVAQVVLTALGGALLAGMLGIEGAERWLLGLALTFSSTVVVVKLLERVGASGSSWGRVSIGVLIVQDVAVVVVLTFVQGSAGADDGLALGLGRAMLGMAALAAAAWMGARWLLTPLLGRVAAAPAALLVVSLTWCGALLLAAEALGISVELGAFLAGVAMAQGPYADELARRVHPLADLFLAVFYVSLAASVDLAGAAAVWPQALALTAFVVVFKPALVAILLRARGFAGSPALLAGVTLGQVSEFGFILVAAAAASGLTVGETLPSVLAVAGLVSIATTSALLPSLTRRFGAAAYGVGAAARVPRAGHVVVIGMNTLGRLVVDRMVERDERVVAVDADPFALRDVWVETVFGSADHPKVLREAGVADAKLVVVATRLEDVNAVLAYRCSRAGVPVAVHAFDPALEDDLLDIGADHVVVSKVDGIRLVTGELRRLGVLG